MIHPHCCLIFEFDFEWLISVYLIHSPFLISNFSFPLLSQLFLLLFSSVCVFFPPQSLAMRRRVILSTHIPPSSLSHPLPLSLRVSNQPGWSPGKCPRSVLESLFSAHFSACHTNTGEGVARPRSSTVSVSHGIPCGADTCFELLS